MTEKRFYVDKSADFNDKQTGNIIVDFGYSFNAMECKMILDLLNDLNNENEQLRVQLNLCSDQRDEFYRGARENANRVGKLEKENEQLKKRIEYLERKIDRERKSNIIQNEKWQKEATDLVREQRKFIDDLNKENEQLKNDMKIRLCNNCFYWRMGTAGLNDNYCSLTDKWADWAGTCEKWKGYHD